MSHVALLGFKQSPSGSDDYIDFTANGYHINSFKIGDSYYDEHGNRVRNLIFDLSVNGSSIDNVLSMIRNINYYIQRTRSFLEPFDGNFPATTDGTWFEGRAATLTFGVQGATNTVFWDVIDGEEPHLPDAFLSSDVLGYWVEHVTVTLTVAYAARGAQVTLKNLVALGSFDAPFSLTEASNYGGWTFDGVGTWFLDDSSTTNSAKYGSKLLRWLGSSGSGGCNTHETTQVDAAVIGDLWVYGTITTGTLSAKVQGYNGSWVDLSTDFINRTTSIASWTRFTSSSVSLTGYTKARIRITTPTNGTIRLDGVALWWNGVVPTNEYMCCGRTVGIPTMYVYNVQGDTEAQFLLHVTRATDSISQRVFMVGARTLKYHYTSVGTSMYRDSIASLAFRIANGSASSLLFWGKLGVSVTGGATTGTSFSLNPLSDLYLTIERIPRRYRALLFYAANQFASITQVDFYISSSGATDKKTWVVNLPSTYTDGAPPTTPVATNYKLYDLGDFVYPRPGLSWVDGTYAPQSAVTTIQFTHSGSTSKALACSGIILIPTEQFAVADIVTGDTDGSVFFSSGPKTPTATYTNLTSLNLGYAGDINSYNSGASYTIDNFKLVPGDMQFEVLMFTNRDSTDPNLYSFDVSSGVGATNSPMIKYQPRYLFGSR